MQSGPEPYFDIVELAKELRGEKLFVQSELESIRSLNDRLEKSAIELAQATWTSTQQRSNVKQLFAQGDPSSTICCQRIDYILSPVFVDAHKVLRYQDALILSDLIQRIRASPSIASLWLAAAESKRPTAAAAVARVLCSGLYVYDVSPLRRILYHLAKHRLAVSEDPRRLISQGSSSFSRLYCELVDGFRPARLFLAAALKGPMLPLLQIDECLIIDPDKALERVKKLVKSSDPNADLQNQFARYRKWTVSTLVTSTGRFISSLREHWLCFPPTIAWVVRQTALALQSNQQISEEDIHCICTNLIFTNFICQAIVNPEAYGISDIPITNISRFNLVQIAQTIQTLCLMKYQEVDGKFRDFYQRFEKDSVYSLIDILLENESYSAIPNDNFGYNGSESGDTEDGISEGAACESEERDVLKTDPIVNPNIALFTRNDLHLLVSLLKVVSNTATCNITTFSEQMNCLKANNATVDFDDLKKSQKLDSLNDRNKKVLNDTNSHSDSETACGVSSMNDHGKLDNPLDFLQDEEFSPLLKCINPDLITKVQKLLEKLPDSSFSWDNSNNQKANGSISKGKYSNSNSPIKNGPKKRKSPPQSQEVLVIKLPGDTSYEPIGLLPENRVLEYHYSTMVTCRTLSEEMLQHNTGLPNSRSMELLQLPRQDPGASVSASRSNQPTAESSGPHPGQEKRTRFSLSHDEGSIGNTSDNLEAVSEAASNHSVTSSLEMETEDQNDNLSDMVSANVSGRGSPNISGRDTPSSQVTEGDAGASLANPQPLRQPSVTFGSAAASKQAKLLKRTRHDIEDKFCKFEIRKLIEGDETISIISDTWSTDVLASDSETIGESAYDRNFIITHFGQQHVRSVGQSAISIAAPSQPDISETASESAWSTDVLVDIDDCNSVTRSDTDTARSEEAPAASARNTISYSNQLSPVNNNENNMACNSMQINELPIVNLAGPSERINGSRDTSSSVGCSNFTNNHNIASSSHNPGSLLVSPLHSGLNPSSYIAENNVNNNNNLSLQESRNFGIHEEASNIRKINGPLEPNGFANYSCNMNILPNISPNSNLLSSHTHSVNMNSFQLANGNNLNSPDNDRFNFNIEEKSYAGESSKNMKLNLTNSMTERNTTENASSFSNNGNATIRWLNDPCQEFPLCPDSEQSANNQLYFDYDSSCTEVINEFCKKIENIDLNKPETSFRPIKVEKNTTDDNNLSEKHISDNKNHLVDCFSNKATLECSYSNDIQKGYSLISSNLLDSDKIVRPIANSSRESDLKECKPSHSFSNFTTDTSLKAIENCNSNRLNIGSVNKKIDSLSNRPCDDKVDSGLNDVISSGSAISLSTLSVNSVDTSTSDKSSSQEVNSENITERRITPPIGNAASVTLDLKNHSATIINDGANTLPRPSCTLGSNSAKLGSSTGAIPKSISFDSTAEKTHRYHSGRRIIDDANDGLSINFGELKNNVKRSGGNLLNKIKLFRNKSRGPSGNMNNYGKRSTQETASDCPYKSVKDFDSRPIVENNRNDNINAIPGTSVNGSKSNSELSDDILAKYRRKVSSSSDAATSDSTSHSGSVKSKNQGSSQQCDNNANMSDIDSQVDRNSDLEYEGLRRELRLVLSNMEIQNIELAAGRSGSLALACALRLEGAGGALGAISALGNLGSLDSSRTPSLLNALRTDTLARRPYISYLSKCRRSLLSTLTMLESEHSWQTNETERQRSLAVSARARASLASREPRLVDLQEKLRSGLVDERREALTAALNSLFTEMVAEESWSGALTWELEQAALTIERVVMARVYIQAMFPNGDGDIMRDQLLHEHMAKLGSNGVGLPARRLGGAPWIPAQRILAHLPAYRTPRDKVDCIVRCVSSIMTLLSMSSDSSTPGADDLTPVLVYILIKANPPSLLSTVQFVTTFINAPLEGERLYCWTQFCAAVEYIKTMD